MSSTSRYPTLIYRQLMSKLCKKRLSNVIVAMVWVEPLVLGIHLQATERSHCHSDKAPICLTGVGLGRSEDRQPSQHTTQFPGVVTLVGWSQPAVC
eukprot:scaffold528290_cov36-Prasinocladus_malaysianus.AAC.1